MITSSLDVRCSFLAQGHAETSELVGRRINFHHASGNVMQQYWVDAHTTIISAITVKFPPFMADGFVAGGSQAEQAVRTFKLAEHQYLIAFYEAGGMGDRDPIPGYPVSIVADFARMIAMAVFVCPREDGGLYHVIDQARMEVLE